MPRVGFEPTISAGERPKTNASDRAATGTANFHLAVYILMQIALVLNTFGIGRKFLAEHRIRSAW